MKNSITSLKLKLQSLGALRAEAWEYIVNNISMVDLKPGESFIRKKGRLAFIHAGILKEYDAKNRSIPAIINFIKNDEFFITRSNNLNHYLKAVNFTRIYFFDQNIIYELYKLYPELNSIYSNIWSQYDEQLENRMLLMEMQIEERINHFKAIYHEIIPYLKKKDISNYLHVSYNHLISKW